MNSRPSLSEQVAIITGASSGIGRAVAEDLAAAGVRLVLTGRRRERLEALAKALPGEHEIADADLLDPKTPDHLLATALERFGRCDILFNSAGSLAVGTIETLDLDKACEMVRANFECAMRMAYTCLRHFRSVNAGTLINVSSILGTKVRPGTGAYAGSKFAIEALTEALRMELAGTPIRISAIEPGVVLTELHDHFEVHPKDAMGIQQPLVPADIARCVRFILEQPPHVRIPVMMVLPGEQPM